MNNLLKQEMCFSYIVYKNCNMARFNRVLFRVCDMFTEVGLPILVLATLGLGVLKQQTFRLDFPYITASSHKVDILDILKAILFLVVFDSSDFV